MGDVESFPFLPKSNQRIKCVACVSACNGWVWVAVADLLSDFRVRQPFAKLLIDTLFKRTDDVFAPAFRVKSGAGECAKRNFGPVAQHGPHIEEMIAGAAPHNGVQPAGVVANHAADHGAAGGAGFRPEHQPVRTEGRVQIIADNARLHPHPTLFSIDFQDFIEIIGDVGHNTAAHHLTS